MFQVRTNTLVEQLPTLSNVVLKVNWFFSLEIIPWKEASFFIGGRVEGWRGAGSTSLGASALIGERVKTIYPTTGKPVNLD